MSVDAQQWSLTLVDEEAIQKNRLFPCTEETRATILSVVGRRSEQEQWLMDDDGGCWRVEKESLRRTRKGRNAGASRDMQTAKTCGQATFFFFPLRP